MLSSFLPTPFYLDTLGTIFATRIFGLGSGFLVAIVSALINQISDPFALAYLPTNLATVLMTYFIYFKIDRNLNIFLKAALIALPSSLIGGAITAYLFEGVTSAGSSIILRFLHLGHGMDLVFASFIVQLLTEYVDKFVVILAVDLILKLIPNEILIKLKNQSRP